MSALADDWWRAAALLCGSSIIYGCAFAFTDDVPWLFGAYALAALAAFRAVIGHSAEADARAADASPSREGV